MSFCEVILSDVLPTNMLQTLMDTGDCSIVPKVMVWLPLTCGLQTVWRWQRIAWLGVVLCSFIQWNVREVADVVTVLVPNCWEQAVPGTV
jgi:hypothetical protein